MVAKTHLFILALAVVSTHAQLLNFLYTGFAHTARDISHTSGNIIAGVLNAFTGIPVVQTRFQNQRNIPNLINDNDIDISAVEADFAAGSTNEDAVLSIGELIVKYGHPLEKHNVITEDGYILQMFRIAGNGSAVFLMHGLLGSADDYVIAGPESSLAYLLAAEGYDVWMGNARGNKHSRRHVQYTPSEPAFWDFSWHEIGCHDLPAMIDYVLNTTEQKTLKYVGHSQGTTSFFVMTSEKPEYNKKIALMIALSPVAYMSHAVSPIVRLLSPTSRLIQGVLETVGIYEFLPDSAMMRSAKQLLCGSGRLAEIMCSNVLFLLMGFGFEQLNVTNLPVIYGHVPSGSAGKQLVHYAQGVMSGEFKKYDHGSYENRLRYGSVKPPKYRLDNVVAPVALFYSDSDWMSHPIDVDILYNKLSNAIDIYKVPERRFNHLDFVWAKDFKTLIFERIRKLMEHF